MGGVSAFGPGIGECGDGLALEVADSCNGLTVAACGAVVASAGESKYTFEYHQRGYPATLSVIPLGADADFTYSNIRIIYDDDAPFSELLDTESGYPMCVGWHPDPALGITLAESSVPEWPGGEDLEQGETWRHWIPIDGCAYEFLHFNGTWWKQISREYEPGTAGDNPGLGVSYETHDYPAGWYVYDLPVNGGPIIQVDAYITLVEPTRIEAVTLNGRPVAVYEPTDEEPPYCSE